VLNCSTLIQCVSPMRQAKFANGGLILSLSQFSILPQLPQKMKLVSKEVKIDPKIIVSLLSSKSLKLTVGGCERVHLNMLIKITRPF
jgi:hypothetical protein